MLQAGLEMMVRSDRIERDLHSSALVATAYRRRFKIRFRQCPGCTGLVQAPLRKRRITCVGLHCSILIWSLSEYTVVEWCSGYHSCLTLCTQAVVGSIPASIILPPQAVLTSPSTNWQAFFCDAHLFSQLVDLMSYPVCHCPTMLIQQGNPGQGCNRQMISPMWRAVIPNIQRSAFPQPRTSSSALLQPSSG